MKGISEIISDTSRIVVKVGSSLIVGSDGTSVRENWLATLAKDIAELRRNGRQVVIVSSGAIGLGRSTLQYGTRKLELDEKQAAAACGQIALMSSWAKSFESHSLFPAQLLLTIDDSEQRRRYLNARNTFRTLLKQPHIIPVVNENDTVATDEIRVGDNDRLAARVAQMIGADLLILLSDVNGLYSANPATSPDADLIPLVEKITPQIDAIAGGVGTAIASGGMRTKIEAAKIAVAAGCHMLITSGREPHPLKRLVDEELCTLFYSDADPKSARKMWIAGSLRSMGSYSADRGARDALLSGKSLLPAGVYNMDGSFERGDPVQIEDPQGEIIGKGLSEYSSTDARRILGAKTSKIEEILGYKYRDALIHRDNLVFLANYGVSYGNE